MFSAIAPRYDFLNGLLSLGIHGRWRRFAAGLVRQGGTGRILDAATGTGDMALAIAAATPPSVEIVGIDFCREMLDLARTKATGSPFGGRIAFTTAPCEAMPFPDGSFDSVVIAFGVRNLDDREMGLREMHRVLARGGRLVILEFSTPRRRLVGGIYRWYFHRVLPLVGGLFSRFTAYSYLPQSVLRFPTREEFKRIMASAGFVDVVHHDLTLGIVTAYVGER